LTIDAATGEISVKSDASPDYEARRDSYSIIVNVTDGEDAPGNTEPVPASIDDSVAVEIFVNNIDEPGVVCLSPASPTVGSSITASLSDPDGVFTGSGRYTQVKWQWSRADTAEGPFTDIPSASFAGYSTSATYTLVAEDDGKSLKAAAAYVDRHDFGKSAEGVLGTAATCQGGL